MASLWLMKMLEAIFSGEGENGRGVFDFGFSAISLGFKNLNLIDNYFTVAVFKSFKFCRPVLKNFSHPRTHKKNL